MKLNRIAVSNLSKVKHFHFENKTEACDVMKYLNVKLHWKLAQNNTKVVASENCKVMMGSFTWIGIGFICPLAILCGCGGWWFWKWISCSLLSCFCMLILARDTLLLLSLRPLFPVQHWMSSSFKGLCLFFFSVKGISLLEASVSSCITHWL